MQGLAGAYSGMQGLAARRGFVQAASMPAVTWDSSIVVNCPSLSHSAVSPGVWLQGLSQSAPCHSLFLLVDQGRHCSVNAAVGVLLAPLELGCSFASTRLHCPLVSCRVFGAFSHGLAVEVLCCQQNAAAGSATVSLMHMHCIVICGDWGRWFV